MRMKLEKEMLNSTVVSMIEEKLPRDIRKLWAQEVCEKGSKVDDNTKFPSLLEFMLQQKRAIEYESDGLRNVKNVQGRTHYVDENKFEKPKDRYASNNDQ